MNFESRANFIDLFSLQVITIGLLNLSLSQFSNFLICPSDLSLFNSVLLSPLSVMERVCLLVELVLAVHGSALFLFGFLIFRSEGITIWKCWISCLFHSLCQVMKLN